MSTELSVPQERPCNICHETFPRTPEFWNKDKKGPNGLSYICKKCAKVRAAQWLEENRERNRQNCKTRYETQKPLYQEYRANHAKEIANYKREWRQKNPDKVKKHKSESQKRHRDSANARSRRYIQNNPGKVNLRIHQRLARKHELPFDYSEADWQRCLEYFGHRCAVCGRPAGFWHTIAKDHWIPVNYKGSDNPGTVPWNIVPLCHSTRDGEGGCNNDKKDKNPHEWLLSRYTPAQAAIIEARIAVYFALVSEKAAR